MALLWSSPVSIDTGQRSRVGTRPLCDLEAEKQTTVGGVSWWARAPFNCHNSLDRTAANILCVTQVLSKRKQLPVPQERRSGVKGVKSRVAVWFKRHKEILHAHFFAALAMDDRVMPALLFLCSILHLFHGFKAASLPRDRTSVSNHLQGGPEADPRPPVLGSPKLRAVWRRPRCGVPDHPSVTEAELKLQRKRLRGERRRKRFSVFGGRWEKTDLTYKIVHFPWQMSEAKVRHVLQEAFGVWGAVTPLRFREITSDKADIIIDFNRYWHGDSLPFDGPGGILAHAFFPRTHRQGEVHFDYDEYWTVGNDVGMDLLQVAAHEFGHVLGLQHSLEPGAVMSPFYSETYPPQLSEDDVRGIQYLYGPPLSVPPHISDTNEIDVGTPDACAANFDAVSMIRGELFFFKSRYVWRLRERQLQLGYPALASRHWRGIPDQVDAAYEDKSGHIWFFRGDHYWVFDAEKKITGPASVRRLGLPVGNIQAALRWHRDGVEKAYLLKSSSYWSLDPQASRVDDVYPHSTSEWGGVPSHIDAAFQDGHGYANFLSGRHYWRLDPATTKVLEGYPRSIGTDFFGCASFLSE